MGWLGPLAEMAAVLSDEDETSTIKETYLDYTMAIFLAKYVKKIGFHLNYRKLNYAFS